MAILNKRRRLALIIILVISAIFLLKILTFKNFLPVLPIKLVPQQLFSEDVDFWLNDKQADFNRNLMSLTYQKKHLEKFLSYFFLAWDKDFIISRLQQRNNTANPQEIKKAMLSPFDNHDKPKKKLIYGENFRLYNEKWLNDISNNIDFDFLALPLKFTQKNYAIMLTNANIRSLPTDDVAFYNFAITGEGYPFDKLQMTVAWAGAPVYILTTTKDKSWTLIITADVIGWVNSATVAKVDANFIKTWKNSAYKGLAAITKTKTSVYDDGNIYRFSAYIGATFPINKTSATDINILIPVLGKKTATITTATLTNEQTSVMPLPATPANFTYLLKSLISRPYGWANIYFYNDCSSELKALFTPFAIWLPRHSAHQKEFGKKIDLSDKNPRQRLAYLKKHGRKLVTLIYVENHIFLYLGSYSATKFTTNNNGTVALTYQQVWSLPAKTGHFRDIIGQSAIIPLLLKYPYDNKLSTQLRKKLFSITFLDQFPADSQYAQTISEHDKMFL